MMRILYLCVFRIDFGYISLCLGNGTIKNKWKASLQCQSGGVERLATKGVVWTPKSMKVETILNDASLWENSMLPQLQNFYHKYMLPFILY